MTVRKSRKAAATPTECFARDHGCVRCEGGPW
jgi:hypothetical protein